MTRDGYVTSTELAKHYSINLRAAQRAIARLPDRYRRIDEKGRILGFFGALRKPSGLRGNPYFRASWYQRELAKRPRKKRIDSQLSR